MPLSFLWNRKRGKDTIGDSVTYRRDDVDDVLGRDINEILDQLVKGQRFWGDDLEGGGIAPGMAYAQPTPDLTLLVTGGFFSVGGTLIDKSTGGPFTTPAAVAPSADPYIALLTIDDAGAFDWSYGAEDPSPVAPADPDGVTVLWEVYLRPSAVAINELDTQSAGTGYLYRDRRYPVGGGSSSGSGGGTDNAYGIRFSPDQVKEYTVTTTTGTSPTGTTAFPTTDPILILDVFVNADQTSTPTGDWSAEIDADAGASWDYPLVTARAFDGATGLDHMAAPNRVGTPPWLLAPGDQLRFSLALSVSGQAKVTVRYALLRDYRSLVGAASDGTNVFYFPWDTGVDPSIADNAGAAALWCGFRTKLPAIQDDTLHIAYNDLDGNSFEVATRAITGQQYVTYAPPLDLANVGANAVGANGYFAIQFDTYGSGGFSTVLGLVPRANTRRLTDADDPYTATLDDHLLLVDTSGGTLGIDLPSALYAPARGYEIKLIVDGNDLTITAGGGGEDIDGAGSVMLNTAGQSRSLRPEASGPVYWII